MRKEEEAFLTMAFLELDEDGDSTVEISPESSAVGAVGSFLRSLRTGKSLSVERLAKAAGIAPSTVRRCEGGRQEPNLKTLKALMNALGATGDDILRSEALMRSPRSQAAVSSAVENLDGANEDKAFLAKWMPQAGELLEAMRLRRSLTQRQLAQALGVDAARVSRIESNRIRPSAALLARLIVLLEALPEERSFLKERRWNFTPALEPTSTLDEAEENLAVLDERMARADPTLCDLHFLKAESDLWARICGPATGRGASWRTLPGAYELLAQVYVIHAEWLLRSGRSAEVGRYTHRALDILPLRDPGAKPQHFWFRAFNQEAHFDAYKHGTPRPAAGLEVVCRWTSKMETRMTGLDLYRAGFARDHAEYASAAGRHEEAVANAREARGIAELAEDETGIRSARQIQARALLAAGKPAEALAVFPEVDRSLECVQATLVELLDLAKVLCAVGDSGQAHHCLAEYLDIADRFNLPHMRAQAGPLASRL